MLGYFEKVWDEFEAHPSWRAGQAFFNVLHEIRPDIANDIRGTAFDPFHRNDRIPKFLYHVASVWEVTNVTP